MNKRPLILITNDDGVEAKGIKEITESLRDLGDIIVFAPDGARSGMGSAITSLIPIKYKLIKEEEGLKVYSCTGTPVDCVKLAINEILDCQPDLLVSGINHGGNYAICVQYSGTMGATAEGCIFGILLASEYRLLRAVNLACTVLYRLGCNGRGEHIVGDG